jgi:hypothetical protein
MAPLERNDGELGVDFEHLPIEGANRTLEGLMRVGEVGAIRAIVLSLADQCIVRPISI